MTEVNHADRAHSRLGPSGASRWMACPGSVRLEEYFPDTSSEAADEGTAAHELAEILLQRLVGAFEPEKLAKFVAENRFYSQGMRDHVEDYVTVVEQRLKAVYEHTEDPVILFEKRLHYTDWVPDGFGTGDVVIVADRTLEVIDLKYGKGVPVSAGRNPQGRLYGLGAWNEYGFLYDVERIRVTIVQPRLDSITTEEITVAELLEWAETELRPAAAEALKPDAPTRAGTHCRFCGARAVCRERGRWAMGLGKYAGKDPALMTPAEIGEALGQIDSLIKLANDLKEYAFIQAERHGVEFPGWKLVEGRSNRVITDEAAVATLLELEGFEDDQIFKPREMRGITDLENLLGKKQFKTLFANYLVKPSGKPTLVSESDPRPAYSSAGSAAADFSDDLPE